ncbi:hypothetical protein OE88DRAFT_1734240 [Heliocybe sulcata]|uniref:Uncharacterized protein n=1 Tax=Heliocybe sulcata TaxID=5364 RepID=A0A5C3N3L0_9AGAM|nr:hypothetical protein OE88DRAFT_1734240 [Heliocybe sulcata]
MHLSTATHSVSSLHRRSRGALTSTSVPLRDDFDAYTYTSQPADASTEFEVYDDERERFVSYHRAEMGALLLSDRHTDLGAEGVEMEVYKHQERKVTGGSGHTKRIGDDGTMECIGRRYTTTTGPERTVSVWREEVAKSSTESVLGDRDDPDPEPSVVDSHAHRRLGRGLGLATHAPVPVLSPSNANVKRNSFGGLGYAHTGGSATSVKRLSGGSGRMRSGSGGGLSEMGPGWERVKSPSAYTGTHLPSPPLSNNSSPRSPPPNRAGSVSRGHTRTPSNPLSLSQPIPRFQLHTGLTQTHTGLSTSSRVSPNNNPAPSPPPQTIAALLTALTPPLTHLLPTLARLGITHPQHLGALARMEGEVRDREVRSVAMGEGVSVFEWAVLVEVGRGC